MMASSINGEAQWSAPPPLSHGSPDPNFSILVISILGILATAFLLVSYYAIVIKCYTNWGTLARRLHGLRSFSNRQNPQTESWTLEDNGLEESVIRSIPVCKYTRQDGVIEGTECAVCLNEFQEDEKLRLLPKCSHAFHLPCIDTWLQSHSSCPLCRANIMNPSWSLESIQILPTGTPSDPTTLPDGADMVNQGQSMRALESEDHVVQNDPTDRNERKDNAATRGPLKQFSPGCTRTVSDLASNVHRGDGFVSPLENQILGEQMQPMRRSFSMDSSSHRLCISITDLLAMHPGLHDVNPSDGSSSNGSTNTKRSFFFFANNRGRNAILPI